MINKHDKDKLIDSFGHFAFNWFFASPGLTGTFGSCEH